jgi:uncharacterized membrane protein
MMLFWFNIQALAFEAILPGQAMELILLDVVGVIVEPTTKLVPSK